MTITKYDKTALVFGASGLIGAYLLDYLLEHAAYQEVRSFGRKELDKKHEKLRQHVIDFEKLDNYAHLLKGDDCYCCLGTTIKTAGSEEAFRKVDFTYIVHAAKLAETNGIHQFLLVSSVGADEKSRFFYNQVKGETENAVKKLDFWATHLFQPSLLLGERNENRFGERIAQKIGGVIDKITGNLLSKYKPIEAEYVAKAMLHAAQGVQGGLHVYPSHHLQKMAEQEEQKLLTNQ